MRGTSRIVAGPVSDRRSPAPRGRRNTHCSVPPHTKWTSSWGLVNCIEGGAEGGATGAVTGKPLQGAAVGCALGALQEAAEELGCDICAYVVDLGESAGESYEIAEWFCKLPDVRFC